MKCYASDYCQKDKSSCSDVCGGYRVLRALYNLSRIPERYRYTIALKPENGEDLDAFTVLDNYKNDVLNMVDEGRGLYIWGKSTGNGKTSWACKIMSYFFRKIAFNTGLENEGLYIFLPTFLEDLRDNYDNKDPEFDEVLRMIKTCRLLIIDDIGAERVAFGERFRYWVHYGSLEEFLKGCKGAHLILSDWKYVGARYSDGDYMDPYDKESWELTGAKMVVVDGEKIKEDTYYRCIEGEIVEVTEDGEIVEE